MSSVNKVILIGRLGKDPELKYIADNVPVARFSLATSETYKDKTGNKVENTEWHNIVAWRSQAEFAEKFLKKGKLIYIEGKIKSRSWDDKDGVKRYTTEIIVDNFMILDKIERNGDSEGSYPPPPPVGNSEQHVPELSSAPDADDLPF